MVATPARPSGRTLMLVTPAVLANTREVPDTEPTFSTPAPAMDTVTDSSRAIEEEL